MRVVKVSYFKKTVKYLRKNPFGNIFFRGRQGWREVGWTFPLLTPPLSTVGWLQKPKKI